MFKVDTPKGVRYMVQLVGPMSYRMGNLIAYRGQSLTVAKRTRDYLVRKTNGAWQDFDPTPIPDFEPKYPPQLGEPTGPQVDLDDIDGLANPAISMEHALSLASKGGEVPSNTEALGVDTADLTQAPVGATAAPDGAGDMSSADLTAAAKKPATGGATAAKPKGNVKIVAKAKATEAMTIS